MQIPYTRPTVSASYNNLTDDEHVYLELPEAQATPESVTLRIIDVANVLEAGTAWADNAKAFSEQTYDPITLTLTPSTSGGATKKVHLHVKKNGGLPGESPV